MKGKIRATSGEIGGNTIASGSIFSGTGTFGNSNTPFFLDSGGRFSLKDKLSFNGSTLSVNGSISSNSGDIGDFQIGSNKIFYSDSGTERLRLDAASGQLQMDGDDALGIVLGDISSGVDLTLNTSLPVFFGTRDDGSRSVFRVGSATAFLKFDTGTGFQVSSSNFHLTTQGNLTASNANFETVTIRGGTAANDVSSDSNQSFVGGGTFNLIQQSSFNSVIGAGAHNLINLNSDFSSILSGVSCSIDSHSDKSFIGAGSGSRIISSSNQSFLGAGATNTIKFASSSFIGAGRNNLVEGTLGNTPIVEIVGGAAVENFSAKLSSIISGERNIVYNAYNSFIGSGKDNVISGSTGAVSNRHSDLPAWSAIVAGAENEIKNINFGAFIGGGYRNKITNRNGPVSNLLRYSVGNVIVGGILNEITSDDNFAGTAGNGDNFIGGGQLNKITGSYSGVIVGGANNRIQGGSSGTYNFIGGGQSNVITSTQGYNAILGGDSNTIGSNYTDTFIVGSGITANASNTTFVENLDVGGTYTNNTQPAFLALNSSTDSNLLTNTIVKIEFDSVTYDQASNYDNSTDTFTAPVTGKYLLTTTVRLDQIDTGASWVSIRITTSNREYRRFIDPNFSADLNQFALTMTAIADMDANDTAHVEFKQSGGNAQVDVNSGNPGLSPPQLDTFFSGYLLG